MARKRSVEEERYWRAILQRQSRSGLSIAKFCRSEGVSEPSFYSWKRALGRGSGKVEKPKGARRSLSRDSEASANFVPVEITEDRCPATIQVTWPSGLVVQVPAGCDLAEVQAVLQAIDGLARQGLGG